uniref:Uncharacterized protein n=1 Tax=Oryza brachyantha TaxID=4533 RepID=J3MZL5_ORYBR
MYFGPDSSGPINGLAQLARTAHHVVYSLKSSTVQLLGDHALLALSPVSSARVAGGGVCRAAGHVAPAVDAEYLSQVGDLPALIFPKGFALSRP